MAGKRPTVIHRVLAHVVSGCTSIQPDQNEDYGDDEARYSHLVDVSIGRIARSSYARGSGCCSIAIEAEGGVVTAEQQVLAGVWLCRRVF